MGPRLLAAFAIMLVASQSVHAYTLVRISAGSAPLRWPVSAQPVSFRLNDQIANAPNVDPGSDPVAALGEALGKFPAVSSFRLQSGVSSRGSGGRDGVNLVSFADTSANRQLFEMAGGSAVAGLTLYFFSGSNLTEADVLFNPALQYTTTLDDDIALQGAGLLDVEAIATHELGHAIGLHHTGVESAAMWAVASVLQRDLDADDVAGALTLYPAGEARGTVAGLVTVSGAAAFGAHVFAIAEGGTVAASALTLPNGSYAIEQLPAGSYVLYVEPLDGPHASVATDACVRFSNMSSAGIYNQATLTTGFPTRFSSAVTVSAGTTATVDFSLPAGAPAANPTRIGPATVSNGSITASTSTRPLGVVAGTETWLTVAGPGMDQVSFDAIDLGPGVTVDSESGRTVTFTCDLAPFPALVFRIVIDPAVSVGGRPLFFATGAETVALTGGLRIRPGPLPCVGDCDGSVSVTVDELVLGVMIALGDTLPDECPPFDFTGDGSVTVDELVQAVSAALEGCGG
jgi:hypothetical protein